MQSVSIMLAAIGLQILTAFGSCQIDPPPGNQGDIAYEGFPFISNFVTLESGTRVHYLDEGEGPTLLLVHGIPTSAFLWRFMIPTLAQSHRVIALDLPNFGKSDKAFEQGICSDAYAEHILQFIDALALEDVKLVLHDLGLVGMVAAAQDSSNISGIALFETAFAPAPTESLLPPFIAQLRRSDGESLILEDNIFLERFLFNNAFLGLEPPQTQERFLNRILTAEEAEVYREPFPTPESRIPLLFPRECIGFADVPDENLDAFLSMTQFMATTEIPRLVLFGNPSFILPGDVAIPDPITGQPLQDPITGALLTVRNIVTGQVSPEFGGWIHPESVTVYDMQAPTLHYWQEEGNGAPQEAAEQIKAWADSF